VPLTPNAYALLGLTAIVAAIAGALTFAVLRMAAALSAVGRQSRDSRSATPILSAALEEAVRALKEQERATAARADASEHMSSEIIAGLTAGLLVVGLKGEVKILNPAGRRMLRIPDLRPLDDYRRLLEEPPLSDLLDRCLSARAAVSRKIVRIARSKDGVRNLGVSVSPLSDERGELHGAICLFTDLTAITELEERLRLKESLAAVGELTAGIAHEFRNGLATILGYSKLFDLDKVPEAYRAYVEGIREEAQSLNQVVTNFLNFARPADLTLSRIDLGATCERAADEVRPDARALGGDVMLHGDFWNVDGDEILLRQAFSNLLRNALEACTAVAGPPAIVIQSRLDRSVNASIIVVEDNGPGIDPAIGDRVFRPFFTTKRNGTGLGLALVQKIIVSHNGRIRFDRSPLGGARFEITLPLAA
jgi:signal transduction histidine kinase